MSNGVSSALHRYESELAPHLSKKVGRNTNEERREKEREALTGEGDERSAAAKNKEQENTCLNN